MRFRKGSKVEILSKREVPSGSWFLAEIVSGNGHCYNVKHDGDHGMVKVQRKDIRPCPPAISGSRKWAPGDIVEVFENYSWKAARIVQVLDGANYTAVMLGRPSKEIELRGSDIRMWQVWQGNRWILVDTEFEQLFGGKMEIHHDTGKLNNLKLHQRGGVKNRRGHEQSHAKNDKHADQHCQISSRGLKKRSHFCLQSLVGDGMARVGRKKRADNKRKRQRLLMAHPSELPEKVDVCASSPIIPGEKYVGASLNNRTAAFLESSMKWGNPNEDVHFFLGSLEHSEFDSHSSSVGSCSAISSPFSSTDHHKNRPTQYKDDNFDGVEVSSGSGREPSESAREGGTYQIHQLELDAYHSIMLALQASGPLSWEREALLTNLRLTLHITNDEHLLELRHLNNCQQ